MFNHLLVPTDGSRLSDKAMKQAVAMAKRRQGRITALHVYPRTYGIALDDKTAQRLNRLSQADGAKYLRRLAEVARKAGVDFDGLLIQSDQPWRSIVALAQKRRCDLIVMGVHGRSPLSAAIFGSETSKVLAESKLPVLVCR